MSMVSGGLVKIGEHIMSFLGYRKDDEIHEKKEYVFSFRIKGNDDLIPYTEQLMKRVMNIKILQRKLKDHDIEVISVQDSKLVFVSVRGFSDSMKDDPAINAVLDLFHAEKRVTEIKMNMKETGETWSVQQVTELMFKTKGADIEMRHCELFNEIMCISGFGEKLLRYDPEIISNNTGKMTFILKQNADTAKDDPVIKEVIEIMKYSENVKKVVAVDTAKKPVKNSMSQKAQKEIEEAKKNLVKLEFSTKTTLTNEILQVYHKELLEKIMDVPGFYELVHDYKKERLTESTGKLTFILKETSENVMKNEIVLRALDLLKEYDEKVYDIRTDGKITKAAVKHDKTEKRAELTQAVMLSFEGKVGKRENVQPFVDAMIEKLMLVDYFQYKMYEKSITIKKKNKAKFQFVMYFTDKGLEDPELLSSMEMLCKEDGVKKVKADKVPWFLE